MFLAVRRLKKLSTLARFWILSSTTSVGSGHPTSSLSAVELMIGLFFGGIFKYDLKHPEHPNNDRLIFSKGHAAPLLYALYALAGGITEKELYTLRQFASRLEGHPTVAFPHVEAPTGSLGQGLGVGVGMALNAKRLDQLPYKTFVLLGDSEMAEGSVWEAMQLAAFYKLDNLIGILDGNRLGQTGPTMQSRDLKQYITKAAAFGWNTIMVDGHNIKQIIKAYKKASKSKGRPTLIVAKTIKGKGVRFLENKNGWHGKTLSSEELQAAVKGLGAVNTLLRGQLTLPENKKPASVKIKAVKTVPEDYAQGLSTRQAYGHALVKLLTQHPSMVVLDAEVSNSTYAEMFKQAYPERFFEMFIAEQNMVSVASGLAARGKIPFVSTFAAFFTRAFDQIRMIQYADAAANIKFVGSHAGVSIGADGASQMGLQDIAMFRTVHRGVVLYPCDHVSEEKVIQAAAQYIGPVYVRNTRAATPAIYQPEEKFKIGGSKVLRQSRYDAATVVAAGITLHEALRAYDMLQRERINIRVIDAYSIKPIDELTLHKAAQQTQAIITVEDHVEEGGLGEAVKTAVAGLGVPVYSLAVRKIPKSGTMEKLLEFENISAKAIVKKVKAVVA